MSSAEKEERETGIRLSTREVVRLYRDQFDLSDDQLHYLAETKEKLGPVRRAQEQKGHETEREQGKRGGNRTFDQENLERLSVILRCRRAGFSLKDTFEHLDHPEKPWELIPSDEIIKLSAQTQSTLIKPLLDRDSVFIDIPSIAAELIPSRDCRLYQIEEGGVRLSYVQVFSLDRSRPPAQVPFAGMNLDTEPSMTVKANAQRELTSYLRIPVVLRSRKTGKGSIPRAVLEWEDRFLPNPSRPHSPVVPFDRIDLEIGKRFADAVAAVLDTLNVINATQKLSEKILATPKDTLLGFLKELLSIAGTLLRADRGDVFWYDEKRKQLVLTHAIDWVTPGLPTPPPGTPLPRQSICTSVFETGRSMIVNDVHEKGVGYYECDRRTNSEICISLDRATGTRFAVLNLESFTLASFDESYDLRILERLKKYAAMAIRSAEDRSEIIDQIAPSSSRTLKAILASVHRGMAFEEGLICIADLRLGLLKVAECVTKIQPEQPVVFQLGESIVDRDVPFPVKVFTGRVPSIASRPDDSLSRYGASGELLGVPLLFGPTPIGALIVWGGTAGRKPAIRDLDVLQQYATLSFTTNAISDAETRRQANFEFISKTLEGLQSTKSYREKLVEVLIGVACAGFERARLFWFDADNQRFECVASYGLQPTNWYAGCDGGKTVYLSGRNNPYMAMTEIQAKMGDNQPKVRYPSQTGVDPHAVLVDKPDDLPWAVVPLTVNHNAIGYISADNSRSRAAITQNNLDFMAVCGALASFVLAEPRFQEWVRKPK